MKVDNVTYTNTPIREGGWDVRKSDNYRAVSELRNADELSGAVRQ